MAQLLRAGVPPLEILRAVDPHAVGAEIHLAALHLEQDRPHGRVLVIEVLAVHVRPREEVAVERVQPLVVGMAEHYVEHQLLGSSGRAGAAGEIVQDGGQIDQFVRAAGFQQHRVHRRHARDDDVVAPVRRVRAQQRHVQRVALVGLLPEGGAFLVDGGGLDRQKLHGIVAEEDLVRRLERQVARDPLGQALVVPREAGQRAARRRRGYVDLQDVDGRAELVRLVAGGLQRLEVAGVAARGLHRRQVVQLGRGHGAEGQRRRERIEDAVPLVVGVAPDHCVEVADLVARAGLHPGDGGEAMRLFTDDRHVGALEPHVLVRARQVQRVDRRQDLEEDVARGYAPVQQLGRPEAEQRRVAVDPAAQPAGDQAMRVEIGRRRGQRLARHGGLGLGRVLGEGNAIGEGHGLSFSIGHGRA